MLEIEVDDDGAGFDLARLPADSEHDGLDNMRQRMREIGGTCAIETSPGRGTRVRFQLPWPAESTPGAPSHA
jgi:two-component system nitrate/nitrite sensor histidine kinase NarX